MLNEINIEGLEFEVEGSGTQDEYDEIIKDVQRFSPNYRTVAAPVSVSVLKK